MNAWNFRVVLELEWLNDCALKAAMRDLPQPRDVTVKLDG